MDDDDYEKLPTTNFAINMAAGALAGIMEFGIMYPLDSVRTRMQSLSPDAAGSNIYNTFMKMIKTEGLLRPVRGLSVVIAGTIPAHALYFGSYELSKEFLSTFTTQHNMNYMTSAVIATAVHDAVENPFGVVKQRLQMYKSPYKSGIDCARQVLQKEGFMAFYRSFATQLLMNIPFQAIHFVTYEFFQNLLNHDRKYNPGVHVLAGGAAGGVAAGVTTPLDVVKTLLNTQELGFTRGMTEAIKQIYKVAGPVGFFKGLTARVMHTMPGTAICWTIYESFKFYLCGIDADSYKSGVSGKNLLEPKECKVK